MMRWDSFGRSVVFAAVAASLWFPFGIIVVPLIGLGAARAAYLAGTAMIYAAGLFRHHARPLPRRARTLARELLLIGGGLLFARFLAGVGFGSTAFAIWGFYLMQSLYFLGGGIPTRPPARETVDPFDEAHRHALAVLDGPV